ncbi:MAG: right-handed parallel beta-helix repeat-containing protein [Dehalococcoidia bacterium]|nr:right-handed parallel beta-helix repeat-containing protein [Dehalococcoidia bacterium]
MALALVAVVVAGLAVFAAPPSVTSALTVYVVGSAEDSNDGMCGGEDCTLREAIDAANGHLNSGGPDQINFAIPGGGVKTINVSSALPFILDAVVIDGLTQGPTACGTPLVEVSGTSGAGDGIFLQSGSGSTVRGLAIGNFSGGSGIRSSAGGLTIECNNIGTDAAGLAAANATGVRLQSGPSNNTVRWNVIAKNNAGSGLGYGVLANPSNGTLISENSIFDNVGGTAYGSQGGTGPGIVSTSLQLPAFVTMSRPAGGVVEVGGAFIREFPATSLGQTAKFEFFASPTCDTSGFGEGKTYLGSYTKTDADDGSLDGVVRFGPNFGDAQALSGWPPGSRITMTATHVQSGSTSGFSRCLDPGLRIDSTFPTSVPVGIGDPTISITGAGLDGADVVALVTNGNLQPLAVLSPTSATTANLTLPSSVLGTPGNFSILLKHADPTLGSSVFFDFFIGPRIDTLGDSSAPVGSENVTVVIAGEGFKNAPLNTTVIRVNGVDSQTTFVDATHVTATLPAVALAAPGTLQLTAFNPRWNAGSNILPFFVTPVASPIDSIDAVTVVEPLVTTVDTTGTGGETLEATTGEGTGTVAVANYDGAPGGVTPATFSAANGYFDVYVAPESTFGTTTITYCDPLGGTALYWSPDGGLNWDFIENVTLLAATPPATCLQFTVGSDPSVHPNIFDLGGTAFAVTAGPVIEGPAVSPSLVPVGTAVVLSATFSDLDLPDDSHSWTIDWGDETVTEGVALSAVISDSHEYHESGVYRVMLRVTDEAGAYDEEQYEHIVVYDPSAGFVTGGGWITSPVGAYAPDPSLTGQATLGFVSQYKKGANVPTGNTQFQFHAAGLDFKSTSYDWLVVAGAKAQYKGFGTINGSGNYRFMLTAIDGNELGVGKPDTFRIRIWDAESDLPVYDNQLGVDENADPTTALGGGSIVVHKK